MDFLVTILIFAAISYFNAQKNKNAKSRRRPENTGRPDSDASQPSKEAPQSPGDLMREIARQLGLEEALQEGKKAAGNRVPPARKQPAQKKGAKGKGAGYGQPLGEGAAVTPAKNQPQVFHEPGSTRSKQKAKENKIPILGPLSTKRARMSQESQDLPIVKKSINRKNNNIQKQLGISKGSRQALRQGMLWSQVLSEPKFRKSPYFDQVARKS